MSAPRWKVPYLDGEGLIEVVPASSYDALLAERTRPVTTSLTPEQMNEAVRVAIDAQSSVPAEEYNDDWGMRTVVTALLPVLFAAWQEQTAAKAGDNPHRKHAAELLALPCPMPAAAEHEEMLARIYDEGAAAGVAASEARAVERFDRAFAEYASRHAGPFPGELVAHLRAALLSEEAS